MITNPIILLCFLIILFQSGCRRDSQSILHNPHEGGVKTFEEFADSIKHYPYSASINRRDRVIRNYPKLKVGMLKNEVKEILGEPDFSIDGYRKESNEYRGCAWHYYFHLDRIENPNMKRDTLVEIFFDSKGILSWVAPSNIIGLYQIGEPGAS